MSLFDQDSLEATIATIALVLVIVIACATGYFILKGIEVLF